MSMTNDVLGLILALVIGMGLGGIFFGGLWLTLVRLPAARRPVLLALGSLVGRIGITVLGFYLVMNGSLLRLLACVLGFILMRLVMVRWLGTARLPAEQH